MPESPAARSAKYSEDGTALTLTDAGETLTFKWLTERQASEESAGLTEAFESDPRGVMDAATALSRLRAAYRFGRVSVLTFSAPNVGWLPRLARTKNALTMRFARSAVLVLTSRPTPPPANPKED